MEETILTKSEERAFKILLKKSGEVTSRDEIAQSVWKDRWLEKYSDWQIDRLIYLLRKKLPEKYKIKTLRNSGYILTQKGISIPKLKTPNVLGTKPTEKYLEYMNNPKNKRKVLKDMYKSMDFDLKPERILVVNSYSYDNVDATYKKFPNSFVYFSNFDKKALKLHQDRVEKLDISNFCTVFDDLRDSIFKDSFFDLVINDFRLNFNTNDKQNQFSVENMYRILKKGGYVIVSVVIDPRNEEKKYGQKPWKFKAEEGLERNSYFPSYYITFFQKVRFKIVKEFDTKGGKEWDLPYRRYLLKKV